MKNLFVLLFVFVSFFLFGQDEIVYPHTVKYDYSLDYCYYPKWPTDTVTKIFNGKFSTNRLYVAQSAVENSSEVGSEFYFTVSDSFAKDFKVNFEVDNPNEPTELTFTKTKIKLKLYPYNKPYRFIYTKLNTSYPDSVKTYYTDSDFIINFYYYGKFIETVNIGITEITENTYKTAEVWYNTVHKNKSLNKEQILSLWINETFLKDLSKHLPNKNYAEELIKFKTFEFSFCNDFQFHESTWDRWFGMMYNYNGGKLLEKISND